MVTKGGSVATMAITILVKNPAADGPATVRYAQVADYLTAGLKVKAAAAAKTMLALDASTIQPNEHGDWLGQRRAELAEWLPLSDGAAPSILELTSKGLTTNRDVGIRLLAHCCREERAESGQHVQPSARRGPGARGRAA